LEDPDAAAAAEEAPDVELAEDLEPELSRLVDVGDEDEDIGDDPVVEDTSSETGLEPSLGTGVSGDWGVKGC